jgi:hypothetical protein
MSERRITSRSLLAAGAGAIGGGLRNPKGASYSRFPANARVPLPRIAGHRDADSTECPGNVLYSELPAIRAGVRRLAPHPTRATLKLAAPSVPVGAPLTVQPTATPVS